MTYSVLQFSVQISLCNINEQGWEKCYFLGSLTILFSHHLLFVCTKWQNFPSSSQISSKDPPSTNISPKSYYLMSHDPSFQHVMELIFFWTKNIINLFYYRSSAFCILVCKMFALHVCASDHKHATAAFHAYGLCKMCWGSMEFFRSQEGIVHYKSLAFILCISWGQFFF